MNINLKLNIMNKNVIKTDKDFYVEGNESKLPTPRCDWNSEDFERQENKIEVLKAQLQEEEELLYAMGALASLDYEDRYK